MPIAAKIRIAFALSILLGAHLLPRPAAATGDGDGDGAGDGDGRRLRISGFVDTSISSAFVPEASRRQGVTLGLDQVELDLEAEISGRFSTQVDLNWSPAETAQSMDTVVEQASIRYAPMGRSNGEGEGFVLTAGKFNAPIGVESLDPPDMLQFSHGLLFDQATPANLTGFAAAYSVPGFLVTLWATNDWDTPSTPENASVGGRLHLAFADAGHVGLSGTWGPASTGDKLLMLDVDTSWSIGDLTVLAEGNYARQGDLDSRGILLKLHYAFGGGQGLTARWDWLDREIAPNPYEGMSATGAFLFQLAEGLIGAVEVRADLPRDDATRALLTVGAGEDVKIGAAVELIGSF